MSPRLDGELHPATDPRDFAREALEEAADGLVYVAARLVRAGTARGAHVVVAASASRLVTLSLANGRTETWMADGRGHRSSATINRYRRSARSAMELALGALLPLDQAIPELRRLPQDCPTSGNGRQRDETQVDGPTRVSRSGGMADAADSKAPQPSSDSATCEKQERDVGHRPSSSEPRGNEVAMADRESSAVDPVEAALGEALARASAAGAWTAVEALSAELRARREARARVVVLAVERAKRRR